MAWATIAKDEVKDARRAKSRPEGPPRNIKEIRIGHSVVVCQTIGLNWEREPAAGWVCWQGTAPRNCQINTSFKMHIISYIYHIYCTKELQNQYKLWEVPKKRHYFPKLQTPSDTLLWKRLSKKMGLFCILGHKDHFWFSQKNHILGDIFTSSFGNRGPPPPPFGKNSQIIPYFVVT